MKKTTLKNVLETISKWEADNNTCFIGSFVSFKKKLKGTEDDVKEERMLAFGDKELLEILLKVLLVTVEKSKSKDNFINLNW